MSVSDILWFFLCGHFILRTNYGSIFKNGIRMRLDPDLIKKILSVLEETEVDAPNAYLDSLNKIEGYSEDQVIYHVRQLISGGYIDGEVIDSIGRQGSGLFIRRLSWEGHQFVENSRNDSLWKRSKEIVLSKVGGVSIDVLAETLKRLVENALSG